MHQPLVLDPQLKTRGRDHGRANSFPRAGESENGPREHPPGVACVLHRRVRAPRGPGQAQVGGGEQTVWLGGQTVKINGFSLVMICCLRRCSDHATLPR